MRYRRRGSRPSGNTTWNRFPGSSTRSWDRTTDPLPRSTVSGLHDEYDTPLLSSAVLFGSPHDAPSPSQDAQQISRGKFDCLPRTTTRFTLRIFDRCGRCDSLPARPMLAPLIRFLYIGPRVCLRLLSDPASRRRPCPWLTLFQVCLPHHSHHSFYLIVGQFLEQTLAFAGRHRSVVLQTQPDKQIDEPIRHVHDGLQRFFSGIVIL